MIKSLDDLIYICNITFKTFGFPIIFIDQNRHILYESIQHNKLNPIYKTIDDLFTTLHIDLNQPLESPIIKTTNFLENYICISIFFNEGFQGTLIIGPSLSSLLTEEEIIGMMNDYQIYSDKKVLLDYYEAIPIMKKNKLVNFCLILYMMIYDKKLSEETVFIQSNKLEQPSIEVENADLQVSKRRQNVSFHHDPLYEKKMLNNIKEGRVEDIKKILNSIPEEEYGVLSKSSYIRSKKNLAISGITLATRYAMEGGLHPEIAYTQSDVYIQRMEELNDIKEINALMEEALINFTERVSKVKEERYTKTITSCQSYIFKHLYEEIKLNDLAEVAQLNPSYLSALFKKEVGISISEYIQRIRVDEAKNLLTLTNTPITEIYTWLNFTDQSYFTKVFKKYVGMTPRQYREKHLLL